MRSPGSPRRSRRAGVTLIEMGCCLIVAGGAATGLLIGARIGARYGVLGAIACLFLGLVAGIAAPLAAMFVVVSFASLVAGIGRLLQPASLRCTCGRGSAPPDTEGVLAGVRLPIGEGPLDVEISSTAEIESRLAQGRLDRERVRLAASLGHEASMRLNLGEAPKPLLSYSHDAKLPADLRGALRSGLPPRLLVAWSLACGGRALRAFEEEYHEEKRPREAWEAALAALLDPGAESLARLGKRIEFYGFWNTGCRVLRRTALERFRGDRSRGELAAEAVWHVATMARTWLEPDSLWVVYPAGSQSDSYATPERRCAWAQPAYVAEGVSECSARAGETAEAEHAWQRALLAEMILRWETWDEDRASWCARVEEWIPRAERELTGARFDVPSYLERIRREMVPWRVQGA